MTTASIAGRGEYMSQQVSSSRFRLLRTASAAGAAAAGFALLLAGAASAAPFLPANCTGDAAGANDVAGEKDVTRVCTSAGESSAFELDQVWSLDLARLEGAASIHVCSLYNSDGDAFANSAVCTTLKGATGNNGNDLLLRDVRLYSCTDESADRCSGATLLAAPYGTACEASQEKLDPFPGPAPGPGQHYPKDTLVHCRIDAADFGGAAVAALDTCSYDADTPNGAPVDCLFFSPCASDADCDDANECTTDACDASGVCRRTPATDQPCSDSLWCNGDETCTAHGVCGASDQARSCDDGIACTLDQCDEISDSCTNQPRNSACSDEQFCTGVELCISDQGCVAGPPPNCSDGVACTADSCDEANDGCIHDANDACEAVLAELGAQ
jgi:hypothetical protein